MFEQGDMQSDLYSNVPNMSMMFTMYTPMFGNGNFMIETQGKSEVKNSFPAIPYLPLEALIYQQMASNPYMSPNNVYGGSNVGQQNVSGQYVLQDSNNQSRMMMGYQQQ